MFCPNPECPHRRETGNAAEFREGIARCSDCDTPLVPVDPFAAGLAEASRHIEMVELAELTEPALTAALSEMLDEAGIGYEIEGGGVQDFFGLGRFGTGFSPITGPPVLRVEAGRLAEAREILDSIARGTPPLEDEPRDE